ncbi:ribosome maturation factor RimM [Marinilabilia sp.]|uniref:ribosome maturation factor RimM n=1 Tax=Marinilabilia sp. TaxID=2021252 RepID=UPI0025C2E3ED|nr:ribosome maturation factor RimM [Marinilabilia sp.]
MLKKSEFINIGTLSKPHGVSGEIAIRLLSEIAEQDLNPSFIFLDIDNGLVPFRVGGFRYKSDNVLLVKLPLLESEEEIRNLMDTAVYLKEDEIIDSEKEVNNITAFNGFRISDINEGELGIVESIQDISGNPLFIIHGEKGELLIPVAEEFIVNIDEEAKTIEVELPEGLVNLNEG